MTTPLRVLRYQAIADRCRIALAGGTASNSDELRALEAARGTDSRLVEIALAMLANEGTLA